jgi:hypothetical protein
MPQRNHGSDSTTREVTSPIIERAPTKKLNMSTVCHIQQSFPK